MNRPDDGFVGTAHASHGAVGLEASDSDVEGNFYVTALLEADQLFSNLVLVHRTFSNSLRDSAGIPPS